MLITYLSIFEIFPTICLLSRLSLMSFSPKTSVLGHELLRDLLVNELPEFLTSDSVACQSFIGLVGNKAIMNYLRQCDSVRSSYILLFL